MSEQCQYCLGPHEDVKEVVIVDWMEEANGGIRRVCVDCRKYLGKHKRVIRNEMIKLNGRQLFFDNKHHEWIDVTMPDKLKGKLVALDD